MKLEVGTVLLSVDNSNPDEMNLKSLKSVSVISGILGHPFDMEKVIHEFAIVESVSEEMLIRVIKKSGFKTKVYTYKNRSTVKMPLPALIEMKTGEFIVLAQKREDRYLVFDPEKDNPELVDEDAFQALWSGKTILVTDRKFVSNRVKFGLKWFIPSIIKFKKPFQPLMS